jgi:hypothetical protein
VQPQQDVEWLLEPDPNDEGRGAETTSLPNLAPGTVKAPLILLLFFPLVLAHLVLPDVIMVVLSYISL